MNLSYQLNKPATHLWLIIVAFILSLSPLVSNITNIPGNYLYLISLVLFILANVKSIRSHTNLVFIGLIFVTLASVPALYYGVIKYFLIPTYILIALPIMTILKYQDWINLITKITTILLFFEILAIVSFMLYFFEVLTEHMFCILNQDGRKNCLWWATMTNSTYPTEFGTILRPSAIYDEPGTFSFIICMTVMLRHGLGMCRKKTNKLLALGLVTLSLAHVLFFILYVLNRVFLGSNIIISKWKLLFSMLFFIIIVYLFHDVIFDLVISRFQIVDGAMVGDNRSERMMNTLSLINLQTFIFGIGPGCVLTGYECIRSEVGVFDSNPFTLLLGYGFFLSLPYYLWVMNLIKDAITGTNFFIIIGLLLLIMIRPNVFSYSFALMAVSVAFIFSKKYQSFINKI